MSAGSEAAGAAGAAAAGAAAAAAEAAAAALPVRAALGFMLCVPMTAQQLLHSHLGPLVAPLRSNADPGVAALARWEA